LHHLVKWGGQRQHIGNGKAVGKWFRLLHKLA
jgi:hypothetical protein